MRTPTALVVYEELPGLSLPAARILAEGLGAEGHVVALAERACLPADLPGLVVLPATSQPCWLTSSATADIAVYGVRLAQLAHLPQLALPRMRRLVRHGGHRLVVPPLVVGALDSAGTLAPADAEAVQRFAYGVALAHRARAVWECVPASQPRRAPLRPGLRLGRAR